MSSQAALEGMPGKGFVPGLQGVLATKVPRTEAASRLFFCEQELVIIKNNKAAVKTNLHCFMDLNFMKVTTR
jgi:hypothetical protein